MFYTIFPSRQCPSCDLSFMGTNRLTAAALGSHSLIPRQVQRQTCCCPAEANSTDLLIWSLCTLQVCVWALAREAAAPPLCVHGPSGSNTGADSCSIFKITSFPSLYIRYEPKRYKQYSNQWSRLSLIFIGWLDSWVPAPGQKLNQLQTWGIHFSWAFRRETCQML